MTESLGELLDELQGLRERAMPSGDLVVADDGWPMWFPEEGEGGLPWWASGIDESENNPYRPYAISFERLGLATAAANLLQPLIDVARAADEAVESVGNSYLDRSKHLSAVARRAHLRDTLAALRDAILSQRGEQ